GMDGMFDQLGSVIGGNNLHPRGQRGSDFADSILDPIDHVQGVFSLSHDDDAAGRISHPIQVHNAAANFRAKYYMRDIFDKNGSASGAAADRNVFQILDGFSIAAAADH